MKPIVLNYQYSALEPYISAFTIEVHYQRHYLSYLKKLNELLVKNKVSENYPLINIFTGIDAFPIADRDAILYNAGGIFNHELYFSILSPNPVKEIPEPLQSAIISKFGSVYNFQERLVEYATLLPGSGYTFLAVNRNQELVLLNLANQDSPYSFGMIPIMTIDVWEHAYYLDRLNERKIYLDAFFEVLDYQVVNKNYQNALLRVKNMTTRAEKG